MEKHREAENAENIDSEINLWEFFVIIRSHYLRIMGLSLVVGVITILLLFFVPNQYKATAVIVPAKEEGKQNPTLGILASFGVMVGGPTNVEDLEVLFKSNDLTVRVFTNYNLWKVVFKDEYDLKTNKLKVGWVEKLRGEKDNYRDPKDWDAIRAGEERLKVSIDKKLGTLSISFESPSPEDSAKIVSYYLEEGKSRLQEEAFGRAKKNKQFIQEQIGKTMDALTRERLYSLYGQEVENEMLARNREQFGFTVIDSPRVPDMKSRPKRVFIAFTVMFLSFIVFCMYTIIRNYGKPIQ